MLIEQVIHLADAGKNVWSLLRAVFMLVSAVLELRSWAYREMTLPLISQWTNTQWEAFT
jgi:hypothetical protein